MNKTIRLLVESFFDDEIFDIKNDIKSDLEDLGKYYDYNLGDIYYLNDKPYAVCCGEPKLFNDNKARFCLLKNSKKELEWRIHTTEVKKLKYFKFKDFWLTSFNNFLHIDEDGYKNTLIIKNNYDVKEFPAFEYCLNLGDNVYLPAIDELLILYLNKNKLGKYSFKGYWSSTLYNDYSAWLISFSIAHVSYYSKPDRYWVCSFFHLD